MSAPQPDVEAVTLPHLRDYLEVTLREGSSSERGVAMAALHLLDGDLADRAARSGAAPEDARDAAIWRYVQEHDLCAWDADDITSAMLAASPPAPSEGGTK